MRELRFRAYHHTSGMRVFELGDIDAGSVIFDDGDWRSLKDCFLMQYTGLTDRSGTEIYDGDILNTADGYMVVEWDPDGQWVINDPGIDLWASLWKWAKVGAVIGNIYENADLLK